jgi:hypothetical protein
MIKCAICGETYRIYPSFVLPGTKLAINVLIFVSFAKENYEPLFRH